jgi:hypothetical protein
MARIGAGGEIGGGTDGDTDSDTDSDGGGRPVPDERMEDIGVTPPDERDSEETDPEPEPEPEPEPDPTDQPARGRDRDSGGGFGSGGTGDVDETEPEPDPTDQPARGGGPTPDPEPEPEPEPDPEPDLGQPARGRGETQTGDESVAEQAEQVEETQTVTPEELQQTETFDVAEISEGEIATGQGVETEMEQAAEFEGQLAQEEGFDPEDIAIQRQGDRLVAVPTQEFVTERAAERLGQRERVVGVETGDGEVTATFEPTQDELAQEFETVPGVEQVYQRGSGDEGAVTAVVGLTDEQIENIELAASRELDEAIGAGMREVRGERANISGELERQLESQLGAELSDEDIALQREDGQIQAQLTEEGQREVAAQQAPFQDTPVGPAFATGARARTRLQQFTQSNVERAQELAGTDLLFGGEERFLGEVGDVAEDRVPSPTELFGGEVAPEDRPEVTGGAPVFAPGPGGFAGVSRGAAAAGALFGSALAGAGAAATGEPAAAGATTEIEIPEDREVFTDEISMPATTEEDIFVGSPTGSEVELPDPQETEFLGVPEQGITINPGEMRDFPQSSEVDVPAGGQLFGGSELDVPTEGAPTLAPETQEAIQRERGAGEERQVPSQSGETQVPQEFIPDEEIFIGDERTRGPVVEGDVIFIGRTPNPETALDSFGLRGFDLPGGETPGVELSPTEMAQAGEAAGAGPLQAPFTGIMSGTAAAADADATADVGADAAADVRADAATAGATATGTGTGAGTGVGQPLSVGSPAIDAPAYEFPAPDLPRYAYEFPTPTTDTPSRTPTRFDLPDFGGDDDEEEDEPGAPGRADIFTGFFDPLTGEEL